MLREGPGAHRINPKRTEMPWSREGTDRVYGSLRTQDTSVSRGKAAGHVAHATREDRTGVASMALEVGQCGKPSEGLVTVSCPNCELGCVGCAHRVAVTPPATARRGLDSWWPRGPWIGHPCSAGLASHVHGTLGSGAWRPGGLRVLADERTLGPEPGARDCEEGQPGQRGCGGAGCSQLEEAGGLRGGGRSRPEGRALLGEAWRGAGALQAPRDAEEVEAMLDSVCRGRGQRLRPWVRARAPTPNPQASHVEQSMAHLPLTARWKPERSGLGVLGPVTVSRHPQGPPSPGTFPERSSSH